MTERGQDIVILGMIFDICGSWRERTNARHSAKRSTDSPATRLHGRTPVALWSLLSWLAVTLTAPTAWIIGALLWRDARSDHPFFWPALIVMVALVNALTILNIGRRHRRRPFATRARLAASYFRLSLSLASAGFIFLGWSTGFLRDFSVPLARALGVADAPGSLLLILDAMLAMLFALFSISHAGTLYAWLGFRQDVGQDAWSKRPISHRFRRYSDNPPKI